MAKINCKMCGGKVQIPEGMTYAECPYCGTTTTFPKITDEHKENLYNRAEQFRRNNDFDKALECYEKILEYDNADPEIYWGMALCRYGIEYVEDPATHEHIPTCHRAQFESILDDNDYLTAIQYANGNEAVYEAEAKRIDEIQKDLLRISAQEQPYDIFICYKEKTDGGERTKDSVDAQTIYYQLVNEGYRVFFSRITLEDKLGVQYEPYIFAALNSAKIMLVIGSKKEYFEATWVKNEWSRFLKLMKNDRSKMIFPCYKGMDPYDIPRELSRLQSLDIEKIGALQDLLRGIQKILASSNMNNNGYNNNGFNNGYNNNGYNGYNNNGFNNGYNNNGYNGYNNNGYNGYNNNGFNGYDNGYNNNGYNNYGYNNGYNNNGYNNNGYNNNGYNNNGYNNNGYNGYDNGYNPMPVASVVPQEEDLGTLCWNCHGSGVSYGTEPCGVCHGTGLLQSDPPTPAPIPMAKLVENVEPDYEEQYDSSYAPADDYQQQDNNSYTPADDYQQQDNNSYAPADDYQQQDNNSYAPADDYQQEEIYETEENQQQYDNPYKQDYTQSSNYYQETVFSDRKCWVYILLALLFGNLGIHNFYAKRYKSAVTELLITIIFSLLFEKIVYFSVLIALVEIFTVKTDGDEQFLS